jgi:hypothetical protein
VEKHRARTEEETALKALMNVFEKQMEGLEAILDDDHDEDTRRKLAALSSTASVSIVKDPAFVQTFRELPGLINSAPAPVRKTESHVSPPWATELIGKLDKVLGKHSFFFFFFFFFFFRLCRSRSNSLIPSFRPATLFG